jgi:hypothetical protein
VTFVVVGLSVAALISFGVVLAALRSGSSDPGFHAGSTDSTPLDDDPLTSNETHVA